MLLSLVFTAALSTTAQAPAGWTCDAGLFADGTCDCGCGALDDADCGGDTEFTNCIRSGCPVGQAPWEHENFSCMTSTCGDGWHADDEACDDGDALAGGGCNADCSAVSAGFTCGIGASGCQAAAGEGEGEGEGAAEGEGEGEGGGNGGGCASTPVGCGFGLLALLWCGRRKRR